MSEPLTSKTPEQLASHLTALLYEANVIVRVLELRGVQCRLDLVERKGDAAYPTGYTEIQADIRGQHVP